MRKIIDNERIIIKVCDMYFNGMKKQSEIAKELNISRPTVSRMIDIAKEKGIVKILISDLSGRNYFSLERKLEEKFNLKEVIIVDTKEDDKEQKDEMGKATANFLERIVKEGSIVGVSMGTTISCIAKHISGYYSYRKLQFIPMIGGVGQVATELHSNSIVENLAKSFGAKYQFLHIPAMVSSSHIKEELMKDDYIKNIFDKVNKMNIALLGIGSISEDSTVIHTGYFESNQYEELKNNGAVSDICMNILDANGDPSKFDINNNVISVDIDRFKMTEYSIGIAGGLKKEESILSVIRGGYINVLVTDVECAKRLLEKKL